MFGNKKRDLKIKSLEDELVLTKKQSHELVANLSHEIRTPIAAILAITENMVDGVTPWNPVSGEQIINYLDRMSDLVDYLLDLSKIESGTAGLNVKEINAREFVTKCIEPLELQEIAKDLHFLVNVYPDDLKIYIDSKRLSQAITNLLMNAIKFSPQDGSIFIEVYPKDLKDVRSGVVINVLDQGEGISEENIDSVFEKFKSSAIKEKGDKNPVTGGTGLGLSIAKWVVEMHGGTIQAISNKPKGALFQINLPQKSDLIDSLQKSKPEFL
ncbi:MAG: HAMP domain-containing histidine kinase [Candidatus Ancillula sp.]|jgi:signal transduction histidine kinase|nr:HAMP domain-containing histidine kinase [Candidatus Ancillula sp.]